MQKLIGIFFLLVIFCGCSANPLERGSIEIELENEEIAQGESITVNVRAQNTGAGEIVVEMGSLQKSINCPQGSCEQQVIFTPSQGVYVVFAYAINEDEKIQSSKKKVVVLQSGKFCANSIAFGSCGKEKPQYCNEGVIENNCEKCGCGHGFFCEGQLCTPLSSPLKIEGATYPQKVEAGKQFYFTLTLKPESATEAGARYRAVAQVGSEKFEKGFSLEGRTDGNFSIYIPASLDAGVFEVKIFVFALNENEQKTSEFVGNIQSLKDLPPPTAPVLQQVFAEGDDAIISWSQVSEAREYRLYKSSSVNPAYISYKFYQSYGKDDTSTVIQSLEKGSHFFVISAVDEFNNESPYSEVQSITIS
ncbi:MAG TPA: hypothetical protein VJG83_03385 [archaeon]|nr:hypothetical protein [archaeon]